MNIYQISIKNSLFTIIAILVTMKIKFNNEFLNLLSNHSYSIYLLQRVVMIHIYQKGYFCKSVFIRFFLNLF